MDWKCPECGQPSDSVIDKASGEEVATLCRGCYRDKRVKEIHAKRPGEFNSLAWADLTSNPRR